MTVFNALRVTVSTDNVYKYVRNLYTQDKLKYRLSSRCEHTAASTVCAIPHDHVQTNNLYHDMKSLQNANTPLFANENIPTCNAPVPRT